MKKIFFTTCFVFCLFFAVFAHAQKQTEVITGVFQGFVSYGENADGRGMLLEDISGRMIHVGLGKADYDELADLAVGSELTVQVFVDEDYDAALQGTRSSYFYVDGSAARVKSVGAAATSMSFEDAFQAAAVGEATGYEAVGDCLLRGDFPEYYGWDKEEALAIAIRWYRKAAQGQESAARKLAELGQPLAGQDFSAIAPCPEKALPGEYGVTGIWLGTTRHEGAYGYLIRTPQGEEIDIIMGNGDIMGLENVQKGDRVALRYTKEQGLDEKSATCMIKNFYVPNSAEILAAHP